MSIKELKSLQFNGISWRISLLGEAVILMECGSAVPIEKIHLSSRAIVNNLGETLKDIVPAYHSIAVFTSLGVADFCEKLQDIAVVEDSFLDPSSMMELPICYERGLDLANVAKHTSLSVEEVISIHLAGIYRSLFIGFTPGFIYADGLNERLKCPRLENPRKKIPAGSVGIAGNQTGIYSLESPGGWNIIGRTPMKIFDMKGEQPMLIDVGTRYSFYRITEEEFDSWEN